MESVRSSLGFYGWKCESYFNYIVGLCPPNEKIEQQLAGDGCKSTSRGMFLVKTNSEFPFAMGRGSREAAKRRRSDEELNTQLKVLARVGEDLKSGKFPQDPNDIDNSSYINLMEKLSHHNQFRPEVFLINGD